MLTKCKNSSIVLTSIMLTFIAFSAHSSTQTDNWAFSLSPYIWLTDHQGHAGLPGLPPADIASEDVLDDLHLGAAFLASAHKGNHGIYSDYSYSKLHSQEPLGAELGDLDVETTSTIFSLAYGYQIVETDNTTLHLLAGARYWDIDYGYQINAADFSTDASKSWVDAMFGVWIKHTFNGTKAFASGGANVGGLSSNSFYDLQANLGYQWTASISSILGYRYFDVNYHDEGFIYDVQQKGWQLGLTWTF